MYIKLKTKINPQVKREDSGNKSCDMYYMKSKLLKKVLIN